MASTSQDLQTRLLPGECLADSLLEGFLDDYRRALLEEGDLKIFHPSTPSNTREEFLKEIKVVTENVSALRREVSAFNSTLNSINENLVGIDEARVAANHMEANYPKFHKAGVTKDQVLAFLNVSCQEKLETLHTDCCNSLLEALNKVLVTLEPASKKSIAPQVKALFDGLKGISLEKDGANIAMRLRSKESEVPDPNRDKILGLIAADGLISKFQEFVESIPKDAAGREDRINQEVEEAQTSYHERRRDIASELVDFETKVKGIPDPSEKALASYISHSLRFLFDGDINKNTVDLSLAKIDMAIELLPNWSKEERDQVVKKLRLEIEPQLPIPGLFDKLIEHLEAKIEGKEGWLETLKDRIERDVPEITKAEVPKAAAEVKEEAKPVIEQSIASTLTKDQQEAAAYLVSEFGFDEGDAESLAPLLTQNDIMNFELLLIDEIGIPENAAKLVINKNPSLLTFERLEVENKKLQIGRRSKQFELVYKRAELTPEEILPHAFPELMNLSDTHFATFVGKFAALSNKWKLLTSNFASSSDYESIGALQLIDPKSDLETWCSPQGLSSLEKKLLAIEEKVSKLSKTGEDPLKNGTEKTGKSKEFDASHLEAFTSEGAPNAELALFIYLKGFKQNGALVVGRSRSVDEVRIKNSMGKNNISSLDKGGQFQKCLDWLTEKGLILQRGKEYVLSEKSSEVESKVLQNVKEYLFQTSGN